MLRLLAIFFFALSVVGQAPSYAPAFVDCPTTSLINRTGSLVSGAQLLPPDEAEYIAARRAVVAPLWTQYLGNDTGYNAVRILRAQPKLALAVSGGGLRASLFGAGTLSAMQSTNSSTLGPLLEISDYLSGLSGGSWTVSSLALNDLPDLYALVLGTDGQPGWQLDTGIVLPGSNFRVGNIDDYIDALAQDVTAKADVQAPVSIVDFWGLALGRHFFNATTRDNFFDESAPHDEGLLFSSIKYTQRYQARQMPLPLVVTTSRISREDQISGQSSPVIPLSNTQFEITPVAFGSFDHTLSAYVPVERMGTFLTNGDPTNSSSCVQYFDNANFVIGTSAALFAAVQNGFSTEAFTNIISNALSLLTDVAPPNSSEPLVSNVPNSWFEFVPTDGTFESAQNRVLQLTDGGMNGENVPLSPLLVKARELDVIIAIDASADTRLFWPNATSLIATSQRSAQYSNNYTTFPPIPATQAEFVAQGLTTRPTFFGCNVSSANMSLVSSYPIIVYLPNAPPPTTNENTYFTNTSTFQLNYDIEDTVKFLDAAHENALKGWQDVGQERDGGWPLCLKCAILDRARLRAGVERSEACVTCLNKYCWSEQEATTLSNTTDYNGVPVPVDTSSGGDSSTAVVAKSVVLVFAAFFAFVSLL